MKVLITGGNGYIAKSIYNALYKFYDIISITRKDFDLEDTKTVNHWFKDKAFDIVIHTAIKGGSRLKSEDQSVIDSNLKMFDNLLINKDKFRQLVKVMDFQHIAWYRDPVLLDSFHARLTFNQTQKN